MTEPMIDPHDLRFPGRDYPPASECPACSKDEFADQCEHRRDAWILAATLAYCIDDGETPDRDRVGDLLDDADALLGQVGVAPYDCRRLDIPEDAKPETQHVFLINRHVVMLKAANDMGWAEVVAAFPAEFDLPAVSSGVPEREA